MEPEPEPLPPPPREPPTKAGPRLVWNPKWPRFRAIGYALTAASIAGALAVTLLLDYPDEPRWEGGTLFDNAIRNALRARSPGLRDGIRVASDLTLLITVVQAALVDGFLLPMADASWDVTWQLSLMNAQALSLNILIATLLFKAAARARPSYEQCKQDPNFDPLCDTGSFASFPSSHTSTAFTAAGLTCIHHANLPLYGGQPWDTVACAGAMTLATATGLFRIIGDRHYTTDVLVGGALGFTLGFLYPYVFHYSFGDDDSSSSKDATTLHWGILPGTQGAPLGASAMGIF